MIDLDDLEDLFDDLSIDGPTHSQLNQMYSIFLNDIVNNTIILNGKTILFNNTISYHPICKGKFQAFEHVITRKSDYSKKRQFDVERANKIHWIKPIIENVNDNRIKYFEELDEEKQNQHFFWHEEKDFIVIIRDVTHALMLITSYFVDKHKYRSFKKSYDNYRK